MGNLSGKVALVTGASRGIGRSIAHKLAQNGAIVAVHYGRSLKKAEEVVEEIQQNGGSAFTVQADLSSVTGVHDLLKELDPKLKEQTGENYFDILVNNAGIVQSATIEEITEDSYDELMNINLKAPVFLIQQVLPRLRDGGRIINVSSFSSRIAFPIYFNYSLAKGAMDIMTRVLAHQLGPRNITVNAIQPGVINTDMNTELLNSDEGQEFATGLSPFGRWGEPEDVSDIIAFLASPESRWITGQLIDASGGARL